MANLDILGWKTYHKFLIENSSVNVELLENKTEEIANGAYMLSIAEVVNSVQKVGTSALLIVKNDILALICVTDFIYLFDSHSKEKNSNLSSSDLIVFLKVDTLHSLEKYIRSVYYSAYPMTLYFQLHFIKVHCTVNTKSAIKCSLKSDCQQPSREI